jgi:hypothetical protein
MSLVELAIYIDVILNLGLSLIVIVWDAYFYFKMDEKEKWTKVLYVLVGLFWFVRYIFFFFDVPNFSRQDQFNPFLVLGLTFTLLAFAIGSIVRVQRLVGFNEIKKDVHIIAERVTLWTSKTFFLF